MLSSKPANVSTSTATPFKGESFPSYVLSHRSSRLKDSRAHRDAPLQTECNAPPAALTTSPPTSTLVRTSAAVAEGAGASPATALCWTPQRSVASPLGSSSTPARRSFQQRASLSDQLRSISQGAQDITAQLRASHKLQPAALGGALTASSQSSTLLLLQATTVGMTVGKLECRFPCPVAFMRDHCAYLFQHPFAAKEIQMVMFYRDMVGMRVNLRERCFHFRILRALEQFGDDYNPANPQHAIKIVLATASEALKVKQFVAAHRLWFPSLASV